MAGSTLPRTPTARVKRESSSSGLPTNCRQVLGDDDRQPGHGRIFRRPARRGNFEGKPPSSTFPSRRRTVLPRSTESPLEDLLETIQSAEGRSCALRSREHRIHPMRDDKVLSSWNGLMLRGFAETGARFSTATDYLEAARQKRRILARLLCVYGNRPHCCGPTATARPNSLAYLEDYAFAWPTACWRCTRQRSSPVGWRKRSSVADSA